MTDAATRFVGPDTFAALTGRAVHTSLWERPGEVLHVRLAHETDLAVVAPCTANTIAKLAHGLADDLLSSTVLELQAPLVLAPAMHTGMWQNPATVHSVETLRARGVHVVEPVYGALAAGDEGIGRMAEPEAIVQAVAASMRPGDLAGRHVVVTAGPTHEPIDPVRYLGNRSSGRMGVAIAAEARERGARVTVVLGPGTVTPPPGVEVVPIETAAQLREAVLAAVHDADAVVMAAAVADFRPVGPSVVKLKKDRGAPELTLEPTVDVLRELATTRTDGRPVLVGFAAETDDVETAGRRKLTDKGVDLVVANLVGRQATGFGAETNEAALIGTDGADIAMRRWTKAELATEICDRLAAALAD